jgi:hypothetical protein
MSDGARIGQKMVQRRPKCGQPQGSNGENHRGEFRRRPTNEGARADRGAAGPAISVRTAISAGVNNAEKQNAASGITPSQFQSVSLGMSQADVQSQLGKPDNAQQFQNQGIFTKKPQNSSCIYYHEHGQALFQGHSYQLCFDNGNLTAKNSY